VIPGGMNLKKSLFSLEKMMFVTWAGEVIEEKDSIAAYVRL
jgi:hypothetical protein